MAGPQRGDLNASETRLLQLIQAGDVQEVAELLATDEVRIDCLDQSGMTPLMHAAYRGQAAVCELLLQRGADVNSEQHEFGYTALMFAGLSGKTDVTSMMLDAGAETGPVNSVGRTAAQMAAFAGQHQCVTLINSFFSRARLEGEPRLPPHLAAPLHNIIMTSNLHPVKIVLLVKESRELLEVAALHRCSQVLEVLSQQNVTELLAMKLHYISCVLRRCEAALDSHPHSLDDLIERLLRGRESDGFPQDQEDFIRDCIRKFPYCEATLLQQLGSDPTAFSVLSQALTGHMTFVDADYCSTCGERGAGRRCSLCEAVTYCSSTCQNLHWFTHQKICRVLQEQDGRLEGSAGLQELKEDGRHLMEETSHFLQELCQRAEDKMAAAAGCPGETFSRSPASADERPANQD